MRLTLISILQSGWTGGQYQTGMLLSIDLQKVFNSISGPNLFVLLEACVFRNNFLTILQALFENPIAKKRLQGFHSEPVSIARGTRQGCPLSSLFAITIETLSTAIRSDSNIYGVGCDGQIQTCALFADDLLSFVTSPLIFLPNLTCLLHSFEWAFGLLVN